MGSKDGWLANRLERKCGDESRKYKPHETDSKIRPVCA